MIFSQEYNLINFEGHQRLRKKLNLGCLQNLKKNRTSKDYKYN